MIMLVASTLASLTFAAPVPLVQDSAEVELQQRLASLVERMERERIQNHIPGLALVVVKDDRVVLSTGLGLANIERELPVQEDTLFAIGSCTKAFTAALAGMLQDDGVLDYDDPVTKHLPEFKLPIQAPGGASDTVVTLRDLFCHRTGFTRMSLLWASKSVGRNRVLEAATHAEPWEEFREAFLYNNVMYLAAGMASAAATGEQGESVWDRLMQERVFAPLGMESSNLSVTESQQDERLALGYEWNEDTQSFDHKPMIELDVIGPAGAINSNVIDMAQWLRFQLGRGQLDGKRLLDKETIQDAWTENLKVGGDVGYGLGWMLRERNGQRIVEHGGNINGFGAQVAFMPDAGIGYVLLTNVTATPLQLGSIQIVLEELLDPIPSEQDAVATEANELAEYLGAFEANFGPFQETTFEVLVQNGNLAVDVPGQTIYELHAPDEGGKWTFRLTDTIAVSFSRSEAGEVVGLLMHQGGMDFELPKQGVEIDYGPPLVGVDKYLGEFHSDDNDKTLKVLVQNNRLAVDVPDQMTFELHEPDEDGRRNLRVSSSMGVTFNQDEQGRVVSLTWFRPGAQRDFERVGGGELQVEAPMPSLAEVLDKRVGEGRAQLLAKHGTLRSSGTIRLAQVGLTGSFVHEVRRAPAAYRMVLDLGDFGRVETGAGDGKAWTHISAQGFNFMHGNSLKQMLRDHPSILEGDWRKTFDQAEVAGRSVEDGRQIVLVDVKWGDLPARTMELDAESGEVCGMNYMRDFGITSMPVEVSYGDYRDVDGIPVSHLIMEENPSSGRSIETTRSIEFGVNLAADFHVYAGDM